MFGRRPPCTRGSRAWPWRQWPHLPPEPCQCGPFSWSGEPRALQGAVPCLPCGAMRHFCIAPQSRQGPLGPGRAPRLARLPASHGSRDPGHSGQPDPALSWGFCAPQPARPPSGSPAPDTQDEASPVPTRGARVPPHPACLRYLSWCVDPTVTWGPWSPVPCWGSSRRPDGHGGWARCHQTPQVQDKAQPPSSWLAGTADGLRGCVVCPRVRDAGLSECPSMQRSPPAHPL